MYNTYIFDLDGTLLSTLADLAASCNYALTSNGMPERTIDEVRRFVGNGVMELLHELKRRGKKVAVVSNKFYAATQELCRHFFGDELVPVAIGEREDIRKKPAPDTVIEAMKQLGVTAEGAVYIGDSDVDIETARNSGMPCISVLWGFRDKDFLLAHGATTLVERPEQILMC